MITSRSICPRSGWLSVPARGDRGRGALVPDLRAVLRNVEELLAELGIEVDYVTVYRWVQTFTSEFNRPRPRRSTVPAPRHLSGWRGAADRPWTGHSVMAHPRQSGAAAEASFSIACGQLTSRAQSSTEGGATLVISRTVGWQPARNPEAADYPPPAEHPLDTGHYRVVP
jgi:hypothetical protein